MPHRLPLNTTLIVTVSPPDSPYFPEGRYELAEGRAFAVTITGEAVLGEAHDRDHPRDSMSRPFWRLPVELGKGSAAILGAKVAAEGEGYLVHDQRTGGRDEVLLIVGGSLAVGVHTFKAKVLGALGMPGED